VVAAILAGCSDKGGAGPAIMPAVPVLAAKVVQRDVPNQLREIGTVEAFVAVAIKGQVEGILDAVMFKEGDFVSKGQLLFRIDPRYFAAALRQAQANQARDEADANQARTEERRSAS
jgi:multidrug efflux system membrane fusion protein